MTDLTDLEGNVLLSLDPRDEDFNLFLVPQKQWKKWDYSERVLFNSLYFFGLMNQGVFIHPSTSEVPFEQWKTTCWNFAWQAADETRITRKEMGWPKKRKN